MEITKNDMIGELVAKDYRAATVFKKNGIDFCCQGNRSISDACNESGIDAEQLVSNLKEAFTQNNNSATDYSSWPLDLLADYIEKKHHRYVETKTQEILPFLEKIIRVHGGRHPELEQVGVLFKESAGELAQHMKKEELILFPYIRKMVQAEMNKTNVNASFGSVKNPIAAMMHEHDTEGERFRTIASLTHNYTPPEDGCNTYRVTLAMLKEFEDDLHLHIHLENNILFPKSITFEKNLITTP